MIGVTSVRPGGAARGSGNAGSGRQQRRGTGPGPGRRHLPAPGARHQSQPAAIQVGAAGLPVTAAGRRAVRDGSRRAGILAAVAAAALLVAACGGSSGGSVASGSTAYQQALAYSQCMRGHGEPGFPDPDSKGNILINGQQDHLAGGSIMAAANKACQHLMPKISPMTGAQQRQVTAQALKFVACMRAHGLPTMQDPVVNADGVEFRIPQGAGPNSPVMQAAQRACQNLMPGGAP